MQLFEKMLIMLEYKLGRESIVGKVSPSNPDVDNKKFGNLVSMIKITSFHNLILNAKNEGAGSR